MAEFQTKLAGYKLHLYEGVMNPITISNLTTHIVALFERDDVLRDVWVTGEVSSWKQAASGHVYFSLKDSGAAINGVMWRASARSHSWLPKTGDQILAHGYVGVYPERGAYQFYANRFQPAGRGQLYAQFEALKQRLAEAGLFDEARKRPIPSQPSRIGVVTSADAAALRDILRVLSARWPLVDVVLFPALVQGNEAPAQIAAALAAANRYSVQTEPLDTLILARGGGSIEDLWAFNDERVAHAVVNSAIPVVCGVGHETDFTIADFVADLRQPTPTAAAAAVTPDGLDVRQRLYAMHTWIAEQGQRSVRSEKRQLSQQQERLLRLHPRRQLDQRRQRLTDRSARLHQVARQRIERSRGVQQGAGQRLSALNPASVLQRGYSIVRQPTGAVVTGPADSAPGEHLNIHGAGGEYTVVRAA